jgi:hypothetical protein
LQKHWFFEGLTGWFIYELVYPTFVTLATPPLNQAHFRQGGGAGGAAMGETNVRISLNFIRLRSKIRL